MSKQEIIKNIKVAITKAETQQALAQLIAFLDSNRQYNAMSKVARLAQAKYERAAQDFTQGLVDREDTTFIYNSVNRTVLQLVADLNKDDFDLSHYESDMRPPNVWLKRIGTILAGILIVLAGGFGYSIYNAEKEPDLVGITCPVFQENAEFNVLLLPFQPNITDELTPHITIKRRLTDKSAKEKLNISIEIDKDYFDNHDTPGKIEAMTAGDDCGAQMVIWGIWEKTNNGTIISTDFKYLGNRDRFGFQKLKLESNDQIDTVFTMSNIETQGTLTQDIEKVIDNYFGLIAELSGQPQAAIEPLKRATPSPTDTAAFLLNQMTLANCYIEMGDNHAAGEVYNNILEAHPDYGFARNNRSAIMYQEGKYDQAVADISVNLDKTPNDADALILRASAYLKQENLEKAEEDLDRFRIVSPNKQHLQNRVIQLEEKKKAKRVIIDKATTELKVNKNSITALNNRAAALESLGKHKAAIVDANRVIKLNKANQKAYQTLIKALKENDQTDEAIIMLREAEAKGVQLQRLNKQLLKKNNN
ncbi:MAG: tetratricopeptide repeat protein [Saprospiraceae bacterium]